MYGELSMKKIISTVNAPGAIGAYSQAIARDGLLFTSGQIPIDPETNQMVEGDFKEQVEIVLSNLKSIIEKGGYKIKDIVKTTVFLRDLSNFKVVNEMYKEFFIDNFPARSVVEVSALPLNAEIEIEAICAK